ncbi:PH domain-containing protein [Mycolicibacter minnesotensis]
MSEDASRQTQWSPPDSGIAACALVGAALLLCAGTLSTDLPGRVLAGVAGVGMLVFAGFSWRSRPKLALTFDGLAVRGWFRTRVFTPASLTRLRVTEFRRIGRTQRMLEIETCDDQMLILSRWDLGTDPNNVLKTLLAAGYTGR